MDLPGIEPGAFCMQNRRDTTTLQTLFITMNIEYFYQNDVILKELLIINDLEN